jgi:hypothetical protein
MIKAIHREFFRGCQDREVLTLRNLRAGILGFENNGLGNS